MVSFLTETKNGSIHKKTSPQKNQKTHNPWKLTLMNLNDSTIYNKSVDLLTSFSESNRNLLDFFDGGPRQQVEDLCDASPARAGMVLGQPYRQGSVATVHIRYVIGVL